MSTDNTLVAKYLLQLAQQNTSVSIITDIPSSQIPSYNAFLVALDAYPRVSVIPIYAGEDQLSSLSNILPYVGPNNTLSGFIAGSQVISQKLKPGTALCVNPYEGIDAKFDSVCGGLSAALTPNNFTVEQFTNLNPTRIDDSQTALLRRLQQSPIPFAIVLPNVLMSDILLGSGSGSLKTVLTQNNITVVSVGVGASAISGMQQGYVQHIIDNGEFFQGYFAVTQAFLFWQQSAKLANLAIWSGPRLYSKESLQQNGTLQQFYQYGANQISGFGASLNNTYNFTVATHASSLSSWGAGLRSGYYWSSVNTNSNIIEMITADTDATAQAAFIANVTNFNTPLITDGWIVTLSRWVAFDPVLEVAQAKNIPIVAMNTPGVFANTSVDLPNLLAMVTSDISTAMTRLTNLLKQKNPQATQLACMETDVTDVTQSDCYNAIPESTRLGLNFTFLPLVDGNNLISAQIITAYVKLFPQTTKFLFIDRPGLCLGIDVLEENGFGVGLGKSALYGAFDAADCVIQVQQQSFLQSYFPAILLKSYQITGGYPFGNRPLKDPNDDVWPYLLSGPLFADASILTPTYVNCTSASPLASSLVLGPQNVQNFPYAEIAWPICDLRPYPQSLIPVVSISWGSANASAVMSVCIIVSAILFAGLIFIFVFQKHKEIMAISPLFCFLILKGMIILVLMAMLWIGDPAPWKCTLEIFLIPISYSLVLGSLFVKNWRIYRIFNNPSQSRKPISTPELLIFVSAIVFPNLILAIVWASIAPKFPVLVNMTDSSGQVSAHYECASSSPTTDTIFVSIFYAYNILLLCASAWIAVKTRNVGSGFSEASVISDYVIMFWFRVILLVYPCFVGFGLIFGQRLFNVLKGSVGTLAASTQRSSSVSNNNSGNGQVSMQLKSDKVISSQDKLKSGSCINMAKYKLVQAVNEKGRYALEFEEIMDKPSENSKGKITLKIDFYGEKDFTIWQQLFENTAVRANEGSSTRSRLMSKA
ncbi:hypothetical protein HDU82_004189 [Entophlyctis luteolus]|nr:hypothetical protein HDU82_004189 [Entophlyctis luteolus]